MKSVLLVGGEEARLKGIVTELEGLGYATFFAPGADQALEALSITHFGALFCFDPPLLAGLRKRSSGAAGQCWFVAVFTSDSISRPRVRFSPGGTDTEGADAVIEGNLASSGWADLLGRFSGEKSRTPEVVRYALLAAFDRGSFERQMSFDRETMAEIIRLYKGETARQLAELEKAIADGEGQQVRKLAHTLKGSFGAVCALRAGALAHEIELAAVEANFSRELAMFQELVPAVGAAQTEMDALFGS
jgi:HPt (histidine-containing phosphotransfer) domain-containing protein